ncbi:MAG: hypothetical protein IKD83_03640 [Firmicutes bacterium]|nr:hypothetical protein [Bacillota bacterium]
MKKRILVFLMVFGMLSFAGCKSKDTYEETASGEETASAENTESEKEPEEEPENTETAEEEAPEETEDAEASEEQNTGGKRRIAAYVEGFNEDDECVFADEVEWLTKAEDAERLAELGISEDDLPDGYYINNPYDRLEEYNFTENTKFYMIDYETGESADVSREEWYENVVIGSLYWLRLNGSEVESIEEQYLP